MQNYLVAIEAAGDDYWWYRCTRCSNNRSRHNKYNVRRGHTRPCGCLWHRTGLANPNAREKPAGTRFGLLKPRVPGMYDANGKTQEYVAWCGRPPVRVA